MQCLYGIFDLSKHVLCTTFSWFGKFFQNVRNAWGGWVESAVLVDCPAIWLHVAELCNWRSYGREGQLDRFFLAVKKQKNRTKNGQKPLCRHSFFVFAFNWTVGVVSQRIFQIYDLISGKNGNKKFGKSQNVPESERAKDARIAKLYL